MTPRPGAHPLRAEALPVAACLAAGALAGVAWAVLAPTPQVFDAGGVLLSRQAPEFYAAQDGVLALLGLGLGLVTGVLLLARPGPRPALRTAVVVLAAAAGSVLAWRVGVLLGPPPLAEQVAAGSDAGTPTPTPSPTPGTEGALVAPLSLFAPGVLAVWPAVAATLVFVSGLGDMLSAWYAEGGPRRRRPIGATVDRGEAVDGSDAGDGSGGGDGHGGSDGVSEQEDGDRPQPGGRGSPGRSGVSDGSGEPGPRR